MEIRFLIAKFLKKLLNPPALRNCKIDCSAKVCSGSELLNVTLNKYSYIGNKCFIVNTNIGRYCSIADNCFIGGAHHPIERVSSSPVFHEGKNILKTNFANFERPKTPVTIIENDVWIGAGTIIKAGVKIHNGAVIGSGSVVTHDVPAYEIWAGNPAKQIKKRFDDVIIDELEECKWWNWDEYRLKKYVQYFEDPNELLKQIKSKEE